MTLINIIIPAFKINYNSNHNEELIKMIFEQRYYGLKVEEVTWANYS
jgi:hypothetical protein